MRKTKGIYYELYQKYFMIIIDLWLVYIASTKNILQITNKMTDCSYMQLSSTSFII